MAASIRGISNVSRWIPKKNIKKVPMVNNLSWIFIMSSLNTFLIGIYNICLLIFHRFWLIILWGSIIICVPSEIFLKVYFVATLALVAALGLRPRQGLAKLWAKGEAWDSHLMLLEVQKNVREWTLTLPSELPFWELKCRAPKFLVDPLEGPSMRQCGRS